MDKKVIITWRWSLVVLYCGVIFTASSMSRPLLIIPPQNYPPDWLLHGVEYAFLGFLLVRSLDLTLVNRTKCFLLWTAVLLGTLYGLSDEWHQSFVPQRTADPRDLFVDAVGSFLGAWLWIRVTNFKMKDCCKCQK